MGFIFTTEMLQLIETYRKTNPVMADILLNDIVYYGINGIHYTNNEFICAIVECLQLESLKAEFYWDMDENGFKLKGEN